MNIVRRLCYAQCIGRAVGYTTDMATGDIDTSFLQCTICFNNKKNRFPRGMQCQHSFCTECLVSWHANSLERYQNAANMIQCPVCRKATQLPPEGIKGLPVDFKISETTDLMNKLSLNKPNQCQKCTQDGISKGMDVLCKTCSHRLCWDCATAHLNTRVFSDHVLCQDVCQKHASEVNYLCLECYEKLCVDCAMSTEHTKHEMCRIEEAEEQIRSKLKHCYEDTEGDLKLAQAKIGSEERKSKDAVDQITRHLLKQWEEEKTKMDRHMKGLILEHGQRMTSDIGNMYLPFKDRCTDTSYAINTASSMYKGTECLTDKLSTVRSVQERLTDGVSGLAIPVFVLQSYSAQLRHIHEVQNAVLKCDISCSYCDWFKGDTQGDQAYIDSYFPWQ